MAIANPPHPGADLARLHALLDSGVAVAAEALKSASSASEVAALLDAANGAVRAKVALCEVGVWPTPGAPPKES